MESHRDTELRRDLTYITGIMNGDIEIDSQFIGGGGKRGGGDNDGGSGGGGGSGSGNGSGGGGSGDGCKWL